MNEQTTPQRLKRSLRLFQKLATVISVSKRASLLPGSKHGGALLTNLSQPRLQVRQLLPSGLHSAIHFGQVSGLCGQVLRQLGRFLLGLGLYLLQLLDLGGELVTAGRRNRESLLALSLPLSDLLQLPACRRKLLL